MSATNRERRGFFWGFSGATVGVLTGAVLTVLLLTILPARGATGDKMLLGAANQAGLPTKVRSNGTSTLNVVNTRATGVGIEITTKPGQPALRVNRVALIRNLNADELDNRHAAQLLPVVKKCSNDNISAGGSTWRCRVTFRTRFPGAFVMVGSADAKNQGGFSNYFTCRFRISSQDLSYTWRVASAAAGDWAVCAADAAEGRAAGTHPIDFVVEWPVNFDPRRGSMWVMWVPD